MDACFQIYLMKKLFFIAAILSAALTMRAQETVDILSLSARYGLPSEFQDAGFAGKTRHWQTEIAIMQQKQ